MRTTQINKTEKFLNKLIVSALNVYFYSPVNVVLTLTEFEIKGGET